jgi:hypothetical protein
MHIQTLPKTVTEKQRSREAGKTKPKRIPSVSLLLCFSASVFALCPPRASADDWKSNPLWHDGLVEKAVYSASRIVYNKPRPYTATFFTNKEQHDKATLTKSDKSRDTIEVWKHNQVEDIPTPNYTYHYVTTSHLTVNNLRLTRLDCSSQEFCGTSFKQYLETLGKGLDYWAFSYMPEAGRKTDTIRVTGGHPIAQDSLPLYLRDYDFTNRPRIMVALLPSQKSNRPTDSQPVGAEIRGAPDENNLHRIDLLAANKLIGTYWFAKDRLHVMVKYQGADGQTYDLKELSRVNYWTIKGE